MISREIFGAVAECEPVYARTRSLYGASFVFEVMDDFGGTNFVFAWLVVLFGSQPPMTLVHCLLL